MGKGGKREFVQVLRLLEHFSAAEVHHAVKDALRLGAISFDAVKHLSRVNYSCRNLLPHSEMLPTAEMQSCRWGRQQDIKTERCLRRI